MGRGKVKSFDNSHILLYLNRMMFSGWVRGITEGLKDYSFEIGPIRPPSEGKDLSLLIRVPRNCPWGRGNVCYATPYNREKFQLREVEEIKRDIDEAKAISEGIKRISWMLGYGGQINSQVGQVIIQADPQLNAHPSFVNVFNWLFSGGRTAFLQDANSLIMRTPDLVEVIGYLKQAFPSIERITSYARSKTLAKKRLDELKALQEVGLSRLHVGLETGDDELLKAVDKGVTAEEHIVGGRKAIEAGFELSEYVMTGLAGREGWQQHVKNTVRVLNDINPHYIRLRSFIPRPNTPLFEAYQRGEFHLLTPHEIVREIYSLIEGLEVTSFVCFDHYSNPTSKVYPSLEGKLPEDKEKLLDALKSALELDETRLINPKDFTILPHL